MPTQDHNLRIGSGGGGFVAAQSLAAVEVGVHARVEFIHHIALMGAGSVWCRSGVGAVAGSAGPVGPGRTGRVRSAVSASGAGCVLAMAGFEPRVVGTMVFRSVSSAGCAMGSGAVSAVGIEAGSIFSGGAGGTGPISSSASVGTGSTGAAMVEI